MDRGPAAPQAPAAGQTPTRPLRHRSARQPVAPFRAKGLVPQSRRRSQRPVARRNAHGANDCILSRTRRTGRECSGRTVVGAVGRGVSTKIRSSGAERRPRPAFASACFGQRGGLGPARHGSAYRACSSHANREGRRAKLEPTKAAATKTRVPRNPGDGSRDHRCRCTVKQGLPRDWLQHCLERGR